MFAQKTLIALLLTSMIALSGCGTVITWGADEQLTGITSAETIAPYSGARMDLGALRHAFPSVIWPIALLDLPLSFALDTIVLPASIPLGLTEYEPDPGEGPWSVEGRVDVYWPSQAEPAPGPVPGEGD